MFDHWQNGVDVWTTHTGTIPTRTDGRKPAGPLVVTDLYAARLNVVTRFADWVGYRVTPGRQAGRNSIARNWLHRADDLTIEAQDYTGSGYSMGHLCPLASMRADQDAWQLNWTGVIAPQRQELNAGPWYLMESTTRIRAIEHGEAFVAAGPLYEIDMPLMDECDEPHTVPSHYWARCFTPDRVECWIMPQDAPRDAPAERYTVSASELTNRTALTFATCD
ncbi:DNA/RNA non-specific endonuclease [Roseiconus lacunae]|uniref:DNA/RNA non-specific endonuclease n=1 Tax=Roseiconus lacunae TaxID=2605694 RepID=UPI0030925F35|nr:DNA/RNA non-specific endonuclease [Stieleria sp. HD01]